MGYSPSEPVTALRDLPPLSDVALEVVRRATQEDLEAGDLATIIAKDPGLALKILRVANSSFYGLRTQVKTLQQAIVVLGQLSIVSICSTISTLGVLAPRHAVPHPRYFNTTLRRHAVLTAIVARCAAQQSESPRIPAADAFMAGLVHDIGELALAAFYGPQLKALHEFEIAHPDCSRIDAQRQVLGVDHQSVGAEVLQRWHLPAMFVQVAQHHHDADYAAIGPEGALVGLIRTAAMVADVLMPALEQPESGQAAGAANDLSARLTDIARIAPTMHDQVSNNLDALLAESMMMEQCCA